ncbi:MAG: hypothetical protein R3B93_21720 [Bacteroidia bacterium]
MTRLLHNVRIMQVWQACWENFLPGAEMRSHSDGSGKWQMQQL